MIKPKKVKQFYEKEGKTTERYLNKGFWERRYHNKRRKIILALLQDLLSNCESFLDLGCGTGEYLSDTNESVEFKYGLDLSSHYLIRCKKHEATDLIQGSLEKLPFKNRIIDCVLCSEVIEHIYTPQTTIREILRISRKTIIISTPNHGILRKIMALLFKQKLNHIDKKHGHVNILKFEDLLSEFPLDNKWKVSAAMTVNITPPILDNLHIPQVMEPFVDTLEILMNKIFKKQGSITFLVLKYY